MEEEHKRNILNWLEQNKTIGMVIVAIILCFIMLKVQAYHQRLYVKERIEQANKKLLRGVVMMEMNIQQKE